MRHSNRRTPTPPTSPPAPDHTHSDHRMHEPVLDIDGPSKDEAAAVDGDVAAVVIESSQCGREGCEARNHTRYVYSFEDATDGVLAALRHASNDDYDDPVVVEASMRAEVVDHDGSQPYIGFDFGGDTLGYLSPAATFRKSDAGGECHGRPEQPDPEPEWRDI